MVFSTCENVGGNLESLRGRLHRNGRIRPIGRLGVTFLIGRLGVNDKNVFFNPSDENFTYDGQAVDDPSYDSL